MFVLSLVLIAAGLWWIFTKTPPDYQQGNSAKIMFVHVPTAWGSMGIYVLMTLMSVLSLIYRNPLTDVVAKACAPVGMCVCGICLITGSLWGKPMWGAWWVWDARLTSMLVLFLLYVALVLLWRSFAGMASATRIMAVVTLVGFINIPIIKFSVEWWNTLHQPASVLRSGGAALAPEFLYPLLYMAACGTLLATSFILFGLRNELLALKLHASQRRGYTHGGN